MTEAARLTAAAPSDTRTIAVISAAHFVSHFYIIILPPLFLFVRADYGVSYTELGLALTAFNVISALLQTPAGFLVDRFGARNILIGGLLCGVLALTIAGLVHSFWVFVAMFALLGLGNTTYHPANYAILSQQVSPARAANAFSIHTFAGMLGSAAAPASLLIMQNYWGWRGAFIGAALLGLVTILPVLLLRDEHGHASKPRNESTGPEGWKLLLSAPILLNLALFALLALVSGGLQNYSVVALGALYGTPPAIGNTALSAYLLLTAGGVLIGGSLASRTARHSLVAIVGLVAIGAVGLAIAMADLGALLLIAAMSFGGFFNGIIMPSRDLIVREVTPPGSFGKVFGFVTSGFNVAGIVAPLIFGAVMDAGYPQAVFVLVAAFSVIAILTLMATHKRGA